jgi:hypothetical protein
MRPGVFHAPHPLLGLEILDSMVLDRYYCGYHSHLLVGSFFGRFEVFHLVFGRHVLFLYHCTFACLGVADD